MRCVKYQALGNDYLVAEYRELPRSLSREQIRKICDRHYGVGSDGIIVRQPDKGKDLFSIHIFNPDGSWVEKSGNGLRIFARYLWDRGEVSGEPFQVETPGGVVTCQVLEDGRNIFLKMGQAIFDSAQIPVAGPRREVLSENLKIGGQTLKISAVSMGNPHCVVQRQEVSMEEAKNLGPLIEKHQLFPKRTNVQFMEIIDENNIKMEIWERGAGYTLASGTSSCAVSAVACRLGLCGTQVTVHMPGGQLLVTVGKRYHMSLTGPARKVFQGELDVEVEK